MSYPRHWQTVHGGRTTGGLTTQDRPDAHGICIGAERNNASTCVRRLPAKNRGVDSGASLTAFVACVALVFMNAIQPVFAQYNVGTVATPVLHYSFDDETFTNKVDNTQATCTGTCSFVEGKVGGKALSTSQGFLELTPSMPFSIISGWSVCAWFKVDNLGGFKTALAYWDDSTDGGRLLHMGTNRNSFSEYHNAASHTRHSYISVGVFPTHTWKHACILISNGDSGKKELWMDGVLINTVANVGTLGSSLAGSFQLFAGAKNANGHNPWDGAIDDIVVYDSFLSSDDIGSLYKRSITCDASAPPTNGGVGDCTNSLASGSTCQPTCNSGYTVSGTSSCSAGTLTAATCSKILCSTNQRVKDNACISCLAGTTNADGDDASGIDTTCDSIICGVNEYVSGNACQACPPGTTNADGGDIASGDDTACDKTLCAADEHVVSNACVACDGNSNLAGDDASAGDTVCDGDLCASNQRVETNACVACAAGTTNDAGDDALRGDTECDVTYCVVDQRVQDNECVTCPAGTSNADGGDDASGEDTSCSATKCGVDEYVSSNTCAACMGGSKNAVGGDDASGDETTCACATNEHVQSNACVACDADETNAAGNPVPGPDTACTKVASPPPPIVAASPPPLLSSESPPPPPSSVEGMVANAEAKTEVAEISRDALLADISDESTKAKAKLLADAEIAGVKVKKVAMALTAESGDVACARAFSKMQLDASLGACDASVSTSRRRRLVADTAYDVTVFVSPATVDETTLAAALESLAAEGVTATSTETDPIEELRAIPGIDASSLDSFAVDAAVAAEATAAASEAETTWVPPPTMPPPPEPPVSPPPPVLVEDDSSAWRATVNALVLCVIAVV